MATALARRHERGYRARSAGGRGETGRRNGLKLRIECAGGNPGRRTAQIRGTLSDGDPEPSPLRREGVETRRAASKASFEVRMKG